MSVMTIIKDFINTLPKESLFTTRMMTDFGSRSSVDNVMYLLVKENYITRFAWGVFRLSEATLGYALPDPTLIEIIIAKSQGFDRVVVPATLQLLKDTANLLVIGNGSTFRRVYNNRQPYITVQMEGAAPRKARVASDKSCPELFGIWRNGDHKVLQALDTLPHPVPRELTPFLPHWITDRLQHSKNHWSRAAPRTT